MQAVPVKVFGPRITTVNYIATKENLRYQKCGVGVEQQNYVLGGPVKSGEKLHVYKQLMHIPKYLFP
jgi:putative ubiquitin-RnfH superfamily antitoxin RatB of RatAB toxin-antitoxin module